MAWCVGAIVGAGVAATGLFVLLRWHHGFTHATALAMKVGMLSVPFTLTGGYHAFILLGMGRTRDYTLCRLCTTLGYFLAIAFVAVSGLSGVLSYAIAYAVPQIGSCGIAAAFLWRLARPRWTVDRIAAGRALSYGAKAYVSGLASQANLRLDQLLMSLMLSPKELGQYVVAVGVSGLLLPLFNSVGLVTLPRVLHSNTQHDGTMEALRLLRLTAAWGAPAALALCAGMPWIVSFIFGPAYKPAALPAVILTGGSLLQGLIVIEANALRALNRPGAPAIAELLGLAVTLVMLALLLRPLGIVGAAIASVGAYSVVSIVEFRFLARPGFASRALTDALTATTPEAVPAFGAIPPHDSAHCANSGTGDSAAPRCGR